MAHKEALLQAHVCSALARLMSICAHVDYAGDMAAAKRSPYERALAKATGLIAGEPDLRIYISAGVETEHYRDRDGDPIRAQIGVLGMLELKAANGRLSEAQVKRIGRMRSLGFPAEVIKASDGRAAARLAIKIVTRWLRKYAGVTLTKDQTNWCSDVRCHIAEPKKAPRKKKAPKVRSFFEDGLSC